MVQKEQMQNLSLEQMKIINDYCANNMSKLKNICNAIWGKSGVDLADYDDLYSDAMNVLLESVISYDSSKGAKFNTFLSNNIKFSYREWCRNRYERSVRNNLELDENGNIKRDEEGNVIPIRNVSFDEPSEDKHPLEEVISSDKDVENQVFKEDDRFSLYLDSLSEPQKKIAILAAQGYKHEEIKEKLNLDDTRYNLLKSDMKTYEKKKLLIRDDREYINNKNNVETFEEKGDGDMSEVNTSEKSKDTHYSNENICKKLKRHTMRDDHPLQRSSGQWDRKKKSEFISDILQSKAMLPVIVSEEIRCTPDGKFQILWLIDGKQRCTTIDEYMQDAFAISDKVKRWNLSFQTYQKDENGEVILGEDGFPIPVVKNFDIRKKKFSQLPEELQDRFKEYQMPVLLNLNCSKEEIAYDIARFNRCRPMNVAQNGWTSLTEEYAEMVDGILKMEFFKVGCEKSDFKQSSYTSGAMRRIVVEGIMFSKYMNHYDKEFEKTCNFLSNNGDESDFSDFYLTMERLMDVIKPETAKLFNTKNAALWITLFNKFLTYGFDDNRFYDFLVEFQDKLHSNIVDNITYDELDKSKTSKDRSMIKRKLKHLTTLMEEYFGIEPNDEKTEVEPVEVENTTTEDKEPEVIECTDEEVLDFVKENVDESTDNEDVLLYKDMLDEYVKMDSSFCKMYTKELIALMAFACNREKDEEFEDWIKRKDAENYSFGTDPKEAYMKMQNDFAAFVKMSATA